MYNPVKIIHQPLDHNPVPVAYRSREKVAQLRLVFVPATMKRIRHKPRKQIKRKKIYHDRGASGWGGGGILRIFCKGDLG